MTSSRVLDDGNTLNTVQYSDVGIILRVTPFITSNDSVEMIVAPEISTLTERGVPISDTATSPVIAKRSAETVVVTPNGETVVIGGLMESQQTENVRKIPILGDIPLLGLAFKRTVKEEIKKELLIFLTPGSHLAFGVSRASFAGHLLGSLVGILPQMLLWVLGGELVRPGSP